MAPKVKRAVKAQAAKRAQKPAPNPTQKPAQKPAKKAVKKPVKKAVKKAVLKPVQEPVQKPAPSMKQLMHEFSTLSLSELQTQYGNMSEEIIIRKLQDVSIKSNHHQMLEVEIRDLCEFIIARLSAAGGSLGIKGEKSAEEDMDLVLNNHNYEGQLKHLSKFDREIVQIMLGAAEASSDSVVGLGGREELIGTFSEMTGIDDDDDDDEDTDQGYNQFLNGVIHPEQEGGIVKVEEAEQNVQVPSRIDEWNRNRDWYRSKIQKTRKELDWLYSQDNQLADVGGWRNCWNLFHKEWKAFKLESRDKMKDCRTPRTDMLAIRLDKEWRELKNSWNNTCSRDARIS